MKPQDRKLGLWIALGAGIGVAFMPMMGPLSLAIGVAIGLVLGAAIDGREGRA